MDKKTALTINLSQEELYVVMAYLGAKMLLGFSNTPVKDLSKEQYELSMQVAERALIAREFLVPGENRKFKLNDIVLAIVGSCAAPERSLVIKKNYPQKPPEEFLFHQSRKMTVLHSSPLTGIRQFIALAGKQAMIKSALSVLELGGQAKLECPAASIKEETISQVRDLVQVGKVDDARALLVRAGWKEPTLTIFLNSMQKPIFSCTVTHVIHHPDGDGDMRSFSILQSEDGLWMLEGDKDHVQVKSSDAGEISQRIVEMVG